MIEWNGRPLIEHALQKLRALGYEPSIVGSRPDLVSFAAVIPDMHSQAGPLGGIITALAISDSNQNIFLAVDLPFQPSEFLRAMIERAEKTNALATIPRFRGLPQPLFALYSKALLPHAQAALREGDAKVMRAVERAKEATGLRADSFDVESVAAAKSWNFTIPLYRWFDNLNTPGDFAKAALEQSLGIH